MEIWYNAEGLTLVDLLLDASLEANNKLKNL